MDLLEEAVRNWYPRMLANGIDYNDAEATLRRIRRWGEWCREWMKTAAAHEETAQAALRAGREVTAGAAYLRASLAYHFAQFVFLEDLNEKARAQEKKVETYRYAASHLSPPTERIEVPFEGVLLPGHLRRPPGQGRPPLVLLISGLDSTKEEFYTFEGEFLRRGMATFTFDGPGQGEVYAKMKMRVDFESPVSAVLDVLAPREDLDGRRVGALGISTGGFYAPRAAAFEKRIRACVGVAGFYNISACWDEMPALTREGFRYAWGAASLEEAKERSRAIWLRGIAKRITCPLLIIHGEKDRIVPPDHARQIVAEASGPKELILYPEGNHVCNNIPYQYRPLAADWMREALDRV